VKLLVGETPKAQLAPSDQFMFAPPPPFHVACPFESTAPKTTKAAALKMDRNFIGFLFHAIKWRSQVLLMKFGGNIRPILNSVFPFLGCRLYSITTQAIICK
jgi:hypothetical protein